MQVTDPTLYDNDAILKLSAYGCWDAILASPFHPPAILKVATFSLVSQSRKARRVASVGNFQAQIAKFMDLSAVIEPTEDEIVLATEMEEQAAALGEEFDTGESQLVAVLINRILPRLVTGDKRALRALGAIGLDGTAGRVVCLEQVLSWIVEHGSWRALRAQACAEKDVDTAVTVAFACYSTPNKATILEGLESYITKVRRASGGMLAA